MTMGTATVASTKVRTTGERSRSQSPNRRFRTVRVGNTAIQIMRASWCLVGGPTGRELAGLAGLAGLLDMVLLGFVRFWVAGSEVGWIEGARRLSPVVRRNAQTGAP